MAAATLARLVGSAWGDDGEAAVGRVCARLLEVGAVVRGRPRGPLEPTEAGRVELALAMARDPGLEAAFFDEGA